jgi:predicted metal-dependent phosphotriesterase family hydrolase
VRNPRLIGWTPPVLPRYHGTELVAGMIAEGYGDQVLASIDYAVRFKDGQWIEDIYEVEGRTMLYLFTHVLDDLRRFGVPAEAIERILSDNPRRMLLPKPPSA